MSGFQYRYKKCSVQQREAFQAELIILLNKFVAICNKHNVKYSLDCGTLLGFVRDNKIIENDGDCDLAIFAETITLPFIQELVDNGIIRNEKKSQFMSFHDFERSFKKGAAIDPMIIKIEDTTKPFFSLTNPAFPSLDAFVYVPYYTERYNRFIRSSAVRHMREVFDEVEEFTCQYGTYYRFKHYDEILKCYYGDTWRIPDPKFKDETRELSKYGWWGQCDIETAGMVKWNYRDGIATEASGKNLHYQKLLGFVDENGEIIDRSMLPYFQQPLPDQFKDFLKPVEFELHRFKAVHALDRLSGFTKSWHIVQHWQYYTEKEKKRFISAVKQNHIPFIKAQ